MGKYEEALERAKAGKPIDEVFPELKESEDERIRKELIDHCIQGSKQRTIVSHKEDYKRWLAWLEKQKEPRDYRKLYEDVVKSDWFKENYVGKSLGEDHQPAEWSEEDERNLYNIIEAIKYSYDVSEGSGGLRLINWLKYHLRYQSHWKPSEEQMKALEHCVNGWQDTADGTLESLYNDLQKLL